MGDFEISLNGLLPIEISKDVLFANNTDGKPNMTLTQISDFLDDNFFWKSGVKIKQLRDITLNQNLYCQLPAYSEFDGDGFVVNLGETSIAGLFKTSDDSSITDRDLRLNSASVVKNVGVIGGYTSSEIYSGIEISGGFIIRGNQSYFKVQNCYSTGKIYHFGGGICGFRSGINGYVHIENCYSTGQIGSNGESGGICGPAVGVYGKALIKNCYSTGSIGPGAGGICAWGAGHNGTWIYYQNINYNSVSECIIENCYSTGDISINGSGIAPSAGGGGGFCIIKNCYSTGNVNNGGSGIGIGLGYDGTCIVQNCYVAGLVSSNGCGISYENIAGGNGKVYILNTFFNGKLIKSINPDSNVYYNSTTVKLTSEFEIPSNTLGNITNQLLTQNFPTFDIEINKGTIYNLIGRNYTVPATPTWSQDINWIAPDTTKGKLNKYPRLKAFTETPWDSSYYQNYISNPPLLNRPNQPLLFSGNYTGFLCGQSTGNITLNPSGGSPSYSYQLNGIPKTLPQPNLAFDDYKVKITDQNNNSLEKTFYLTIQAEFTVTPTQINENKGMININYIHNGIGPYIIKYKKSTEDAYKIFTPISISSIFSNAIINLSSGDYNIKIIGTDSCEKDFIVTVNENPQTTINNSKNSILYLPYGKKIVLRANDIINNNNNSNSNISIVSNYSWYKDGIFYSNNKNILISKEGLYTLKINGEEKGANCKIIYSL